MYTIYICLFIYTNISAPLMKNPSLSGQGGFLHSLEEGLEQCIHYSINNVSGQAILSCRAVEDGTLSALVRGVGTEVGLT